MNKVCIIEIRNIQGDYAKCLEFIKAVECRTLNNRIERLTNACKGLQIQIGYTEVSFSPRYLEEPLHMTERGKPINAGLQNKHLITESELQGLLLEKHEITYHVRVHFIEKNIQSNYGEIIHLQYLAMLLKDVESLLFQNRNTKRRITVFLVPRTGGEYPFQNICGEIDFDLYDYASQYLRLLAKQYTGVIYGLKQTNNHSVVTSLGFRQSKQNTTFFPLLIINNEKYVQLFVDSIIDLLDDLFQLNKNNRFGDADAEDPNIAMRDYIVETDIKRIRNVVETLVQDWRQERQEIQKFLMSKGDICLMHFSLFAFMLSDQKSIEDNDAYSYESIWQMAQELSRGLRQIVQNALQHTHSQECCFTFYLHTKGEQEEKNSFYKRMAERFPEVAFVSGGRDEALEIIISDLNEKEDMIDNFVGNLQYEIGELKKIQGNATELEGHASIIKNRETLAIRNFFAEYEDDDPIDSWMLFRKEDLVAHIGLGQFAQTASRCSAAVKVISSKNSILKDAKHFFYKSYAEGADNSFHKFNGKEEVYVIPGTQFSIIVPIGALDSTRKGGVSQLRQKTRVAENYRSYATFLEYREQSIVVSITGKANMLEGVRNEFLDAQKKYKLVQQWTRYWKIKFQEQLEEKKIRETQKIFSQYVINFDFTKALDISYFTDFDYIEVCLKGIVGALEVFEKENTEFYLAMTNLPDGFIDAFRRICVLFSVKDFPSKLQIFMQENYKSDQSIKRVIMLGSDFSEAISNSYVLSLEQGVEGFDKKDCNKSNELKALLMPNNINEETPNIENLIGAMPFDVILKCGEGDEDCLFGRQLANMAEGSLDEEIVGYKINDTHMRLGSKVHIESFYEMSFLFYRTTIANRLAFMILQHLLKTYDKEGGINLLKDPILFYGYASYSKAILTSITEILQAYRKIKKSGTHQYIAFASFQHNLMLESEETQMYFGLQDNDTLGRVDAKNHLILNKNTKIVQIVPISTTLTTFGKMWKKFMASVSEETYQRISLEASYTIFWIVDRSGNPEKGLPSDIEKKYWEKVDGQKIETRLQALEGESNSSIYFFKRSTVTWYDPLRCELCYPEYVIDEVPLVETDPTSTVPTQQIRYKTQMQKSVTNMEDDICDNFMQLADCISYDHICRRQNHYQFYIDTQKYFYKVKGRVKKWLRSLEDDLESAEGPVLHIIFSPEHNTNVGFAQYVNTHYFKGLAEVVSINVDKQFRSNFVCEHAALKEMIEKLYQDNVEEKYCPVKFYFVDDTIITGETFEKANGLLQSLIPKGVYSTNLFSKIFLLIDRLSNDTKQLYVNDIEHNFLSFLHIDVSNTRTHGDSCIGCKLEQDAEKMYKRSGTRNMARHWSVKMQDYQKKEYDNRDKIARIDKEKSYRMLVFSHAMQNIIVKQEHYGKLGDAYDALMDVSCWLLSEKDNEVGYTYGFDNLLFQHKGIEGICALFKTICRPFLSYDFTLRRQFFTFFILLAELFIETEENDIVPESLEEKNHISFLFEHDWSRIRNAKNLVELIKQELDKQKESKLEFLHKYILESLTDMGSNYVMRKQTLCKTYAYIKGNNFPLEEQKGFWDAYEVDIHRLVSNNADETKELWLEYLYMSGEEYREFEGRYGEGTNENFKPTFLYTEITGDTGVREEDKYFYQFCHNLFLQNIGINFDNLEEKIIESGDLAQSQNRFLKEYWRQIHCLINFKNPFAEVNQTEVYNTESEEALFKFLQSQKDQNNNTDIIPVKEWYQDLLTHIVNVISVKYHVRDINIALLTETMNKDKDLEHIQRMDIVEEKLDSCKISLPETRYCIKDRVVKALCDTQKFDLESNGYYLNEDLEDNGFQRPYVIAFFDNPKSGNNEEKIGLEQKIARVFLYISMEKQEFGVDLQFVLLMILREVMTYRNRILRCLQKDFAGDLYARYARKNGEQNILSHEKAHSHNTTADDLITLEIFQDQKNFEKNYEIIKMQDAKDWLLLRNYTNGQIAKIFNRSFNDSHDENDENTDSPMLYIPEKVQNQNVKNDPFKCALKYFSDLNLKNISSVFWDRRIELLNEIVELQYDESLEHAVFIQGVQGQYYNLEYFRCILIDMIISAIKYESIKYDYLLRIDRLFEINYFLNMIEKSKVSENDLKEYRELFEAERCTVKIYREKSPHDQIDYLVVCNSINTKTQRMANWERQNESIEHRLRDPLDFADGHMSLLAIKRYVENLDVSKKLRCRFRYICKENSDGKKQYFFENCLPVLEREDEKKI